MKATNKVKVSAALESKKHGKWWHTKEVQQRVDELFPEEAPHKLERIIWALHSLNMSDFLEMRAVPSEEDPSSQQAQFALKTGGMALRATNLLTELNPS